MRNTNFQNVVDVLHLSIVAKETYLSIEVMEIIYYFGYCRLGVVVCNLL